LDDLELDLEELDDRIDALTDTVTELEDSKHILSQYKINLTTFFQSRGKLLQMIQNYKRLTFNKKDVFSKLSQKE
jgi:uncharacterized membrane-anchored protein YhcB (DUF1043 family)